MVLSLKEFNELNYKGKENKKERLLKSVENIVDSHIISNIGEKKKIEINIEKIVSSFNLIEINPREFKEIKKELKNDYVLEGYEIEEKNEHLYFYLDYKKEF